MKKDNPSHAYPNSGILLVEEFIKKFNAPLHQVTFWVFLILGIFIFSAIGIWVEVIKFFKETNYDLNSLATALYTFFPALGCTSTMQLVFKDAEEKKYWRSAAFFMCIVLILIFGFINLIPSVTWKLILSTVFSLIAVLIWWVANSNEECFYDTAPPDSPIGGDVNNDLDGNLNGFKVK